jgi:hypothetical protein
MTPRIRAVTVPVFFYLAVTLGVPVVRGAASHRGFLAHAATLLFVVTAVSAAWAYLPRLVSRAMGRTRPARP